MIDRKRTLTVAVSPCLKRANGNDVIKEAANCGGLTFSKPVSGLC